MADGFYGPKDPTNSIKVLTTVLFGSYGIMAYRRKAVVGGTAGPAMAVPLFCPSCNNCNIVLFFVFKLNQNKSNNFINQPIYSFG